MRCWLSSGLPGMFCAMSSLDVFFFACHHLESTTLQPSRVDGLVDTVCDLSCGIYALLQYLPVFLSQFSAGLLHLLRGPDMRRARSCACIADGKHSVFVVIFHVSLAYIPPKHCSHYEKVGYKILTIGPIMLW